MTEAAHPTSPRGLLLTLIALFLLAGLSLILRYAHLENWGYPVALGIAVIKAVLVAIFFMEILTERPTVGLALITGVLLLVALMVFVLADIMTRAAPPLSSPPGMEERAHG